MRVAVVPKPRRPLGQRWRRAYKVVMSPHLARLLGLIVLLAAGAARADRAPAPGTIHLPMTLVAETRSVPAGGTVTLALDSRPEPGWHGYWGANPGDAGFPPKADSGGS